MLGFKGAKFIQFIGLFIIQSFIIQASAQINPAIDCIEEYLPLLTGKKVAVVANHTSLKGEIHLVDFLLSQHIDVKKVFAPEHGFRGKADAGAHIKDGVDSKTGLPIISLYGKNKKPSNAQLTGIEVVIFDIQDVGARFYTYISTMSLVMEACAENNIKMIVLDRPNPNGFFIDGPVLKEGFESFVGMHPVPVVYGMTMAEYAQMVNGEGWLKDGIKCNLVVVKNKGYNHNSKYQLPVKPSPNLPNMLSIYLYPSLCFFEGTDVSVGRGTDKPFQQYGAPWNVVSSYIFKPEPNEGASNPKHKGEYCGGASYGEELIADYEGEINLHPLLTMYNQAPENLDFFNSFFKKLAGTDELQKQIEQGWSEKKIKASWQDDLMSFKEIRKKYLLYPDFY